MRDPFDYEAWLIDLDGTLYYQQLVRLMMIFELAVCGRSSISALRVFRRQQEQLRSEADHADTDPFQRQIAETATALDVAPERIASIVNEWMIARPGKWLRMFRRRGLLKHIAEFKARGGKTALVSDYPAQSKLLAMQASELFDGVIACGEPGGPCALKPDPSGLLLAARTLTVSSRNCLVIGDRSQVDGEAASRAGMDFRHVRSRWKRR